MLRSVSLSKRQAQLLEERARQVSPELLPAVRRVARSLGSNVYLVGGAVRDLVHIGRVTDLDLLVEGDGRAFARSLAEALGGSVREHPQFGTASVEVQVETLDVTTARREQYDSPAALPRVEPGVLAEDLGRRDFTVNTLIIDLGNDRPLEILDHYGALEDIERECLRVLHDRSFIDDPTRVLRGIGFEGRLGFRMDEATEGLVREALAVGAFEALSGDRLRREILRLLDPSRGQVEMNLQRLSELGLLKILHPGLDYPEASRGRIARVLAAVSALPSDMEGDGWRFVLPLVLEPLQEADREAAVDRLAIAPGDRQWLLSAMQVLEQATEALQDESTTPFEVDVLLRPMKGEQIAHLLASDNAPVVQWTRRWLDELRSFRLSVTGQDLVEAGYSPGPRIGRALERTREARLNGHIGADQELEFALEALKSAMRGEDEGE